MHASNTDMWEAYRTENDPREEEYFRNRLVEHLSGLMPEAIRLEPELRMPERRRADFVAIRNAMGLPVEITRFSSRVQHLARMIDRGLSSCLAAVPDTNDHRCFAIDSVSQHVGSGAEPHDELTTIGTVSEGATEFRQLLKPARAIQDGTHGACRGGGLLPDQKVMEPLYIVKCFGQPQDARQSPAFPAAAFANAFSRMAASS